MTVLAFLLTLLQIVLAGLGYAMESKQLFYMIVVYGSPFYLLMNMLGPDSVVFSGNMFYIGMFIFHIIKYLAIFRAQSYGDRGGLFWMAAFFEVTYLGLAGYYIN
jgi:hypothetical protein